MEPPPEDEPPPGLVQGDGEVLRVYVCGTGSVFGVSGGGWGDKEASTASPLGRVLWGLTSLGKRSEAGARAP